MSVKMGSPELAPLLNLTPQRINQLAQSGFFQKDENGKFDAAEAIEIFYRNKYHAGRKSDVSFDVEHAMLEKAKRKKAEIELQELEGKLLYADDVEHLMAGMILTCKARLLTLPTKVTPKIIGEKNPAVIVETLKDAVFEALNELQEVPASKIMEAESTIATDA